jgi:hypothetical protein
MPDHYFITHSNIIRKHAITRDFNIDPNNEIFVNFVTFIKALYKKETISYPKFYKMDNMSKLGFLGTEMLLRDNSFFDRYSKEEIGIIMMNSSSSLDTDLLYNQTIKDKSNYFPSPSLFVYTLPNILIGEICIRHGIKGENAFFIFDRFEPQKILDLVHLLLDEDRAQACLCGWVEVLEDNFESVMFLVEKEKRMKEFQLKNEYSSFDIENLKLLYQNKK